MGCHCTSATQGWLSRTCKVIAGEFAGYRKFPGINERNYVTGYEKAIIEDSRKKNGMRKPKIWGLRVQRP